MSMGHLNPKTCTILLNFGVALGCPCHPRQIAPLRWHIQAYLGLLRHSVKLRTYPRLHGRDGVSRTNPMDTIELLYSYLAGMNGIAYTMYCLDL
jgi:hypothetical protein